MTNEDPRSPMSVRQLKDPQFLARLLRANEIRGHDPIALIRWKLWTAAQIQELPESMRMAKSD